MNSFKRVYLSITKRKSKSLTLLLLIFLIGNVIAGASAISSATEKLEENMKSKIGAKATVSLDFSKISMTSQEPLKSLSIEDVDKLSTLPQVKEVSYDMSTPLISDELKSYQSQDNDSSSQSGNVVMNSLNSNENYFDLKGEKNNNLSEFLSKEIELKEGKILDRDSKEKQILISEKLADKNKLKVGDKITLHSYLPGDINDSNSKMIKTSDLEFNISGIYKVNPTKNSNNPMASFLEEMQHNTLYTNFETVKDIEKASSDALIKKFPDMCKDESTCRYSIIPTFTLNSVDESEAFKEEAYKIVDKDSFKIETSQDAFDKVAGSIVSMKDMSKLVLVFGILASILILTLVLFLFIRDRKIEFGIYQALGETKYKSTLHVLYEVLFISIIGISLSLITGNLLAKNISQSMINNQTQESKNQYINQGMVFDPFEKPLLDISEEEINSNFKIEQSVESVALFYSLMIASTTIATGLSSLSILKFKPREILL